MHIGNEYLMTEPRYAILKCISNMHIDVNIRHGYAYRIFKSDTQTENNNEAYFGHMLSSSDVQESSASGFLRKNTPVDTNNDAELT